MKYSQCYEYRAKITYLISRYWDSTVILYDHTPTQKNKKYFCWDFPSPLCKIMGKNSRVAKFGPKLKNTLFHAWKFVTDCLINSTLGVKEMTTNYMYQEFWLNRLNFIEEILPGNWNLVCVVIRVQDKEVLLFLSLWRCVFLEIQRFISVRFLEQKSLFVYLCDNCTMKYCSNFM